MGGSISVLRSLLSTCAPAAAFTCLFFSYLVYVAEAATDGKSALSLHFDAAFR